MIYEVVSGSHSYGLATENSDVDIKGIYLPSKTAFYSSHFQDQINDQMYDHVYYELGKFFKLLLKSNPTILEMLGAKQNHKLKGHRELDALDLNRILSKDCEETFLGYALSQIRKARKVRSKILLEESHEEKTVRDFCRVVEGGQLIELNTFLRSRDLAIDQLGVYNLDSSVGLYELHSEGRGLTRESQSGRLKASGASGAEVLGLIHYDSRAHKQYIKDFSGYWQWNQSKRNSIKTEEPFVYDAKNMMHVFRLLLTARDIAQQGKLIVFRPEQEFLLEIRNSKIAFDQLVPQMEDLIEEVRGAFANSDLRKSPDEEYLREKLISIRTAHYD